jgi:hypothetical protein
MDYRNNNLILLGFGVFIRLPKEPEGTGDTNDLFMTNTNYIANGLKLTA